MCFHVDPSDDLVLDFPEVRQSKDYTCGVSALQAILYYYGFSHREDQLEKMLKVKKSTGTPPSQIISWCRQMGFHVIEKDHMTIEEIRSFLSRQIPILVAYQAWGLPGTYQKTWDSGHYSVIIGVIGDKIIFEDPLGTL
jgi:hypothetical protein